MSVCVLLDCKIGAKRCDIALGRGAEELFVLAAEVRGVLVADAKPSARHIQILAELNSAVRTIEVRGQRLPDGVLVFSGVEAPPKK